MPKGRRGKEASKGDKKRERAVRQAHRRERAAGAYLRPSDPDFRSFSNQLAAQGLRLQDVPGDGNCLFRSLAQQLGDRLVTHDTLRRDIVQYMRLHRDQFEPFVADGDSYDDYLSQLARDGEYAGNDVIVAFTRAFSTHVVIHQLNSPRWEVMAPPSATSTLLKQQTFHVAYLNGEHYCSVYPIQPKDTLPKTTSLPPHMEPHSLETARRGQVGGVTAVGREGREEGGRKGRTGRSAVERVVSATGCQDDGLVHQVLSENSYNADLAIVELLQLMDLGRGVGGGSSDSEEVLAGAEKTKKYVPKSLAKFLIKERKAQAKAERKERRREEKGARGKEDDTNTTHFDPVGAMAI